MPTENSYNTVANQFYSSLRREGKVIIQITTGREIICLFRRNSDKNETSNRVTIFYPASSEVIQGQLFGCGNKTYIALNQESAENNIHLKSDLLQTNTDIKTYSHGLEINLKAHAYDLMEAQPTDGTTRLVGGQLKLITEDNPVSRALDLDNVFTALGGSYKIVNLLSR